MKGKWRIRVPGTCGELIQTLKGGQECLVSFPINRYNEVRMSWETRENALASQQRLFPKSIKALEIAGEMLDLKPEDLTQIQIERSCELSIGKGMASSTADLMAILMGASLLVGKPFDEEMLLKLCCQIEASDGIMFSGWTLIDHLEGTVMKRFEKILPVEVLMLTPEETFVTEKLRSGKNYSQLLESKTNKPLDLFSEAMKTKSLSLLGKATTQSLIENQNILQKAYLDELLEIADKHQCHGLVGGHSGTISGILFTDGETDREALLKSILSSDVKTYYKNIEFAKAINGGAQIEQF